MSRPNLDNIRALGDFSTVFRWDISFPMGGVDLATDADLSTCCESTDLPQRTNQKIEIAIRGHKHYQPGIMQVGGMFTCKFVEPVGAGISAWLQQWAEDVWLTNEGTVSASQAIRDPITIKRLSSVDNETPIFTYHMHSCFLETFTLPPLDGSSSAAFTPGISFSYDYFTTA